MRSVVRLYLGPSTGAGLLFPKVQTYKATLHKILDRRLYPNERNGVLSELPAELTRADPRHPRSRAPGPAFRGPTDRNDPVPRRVGAVAQLGERRFCKPEVVGSIPISSILRAMPGRVRRTSPGIPPGIPTGSINTLAVSIFDNLDG